MVGGFLSLHSRYKDPPPELLISHMLSHDVLRFSVKPPLPLSPVIICSRGESWSLFTVQSVQSGNAKTLHSMQGRLSEQTSVNQQCEHLCSNVTHKARTSVGVFQSTHSK